MKIILIAVLAALAYGIGTPISKIAYNKGMHADGFTLIYGISLILISLFTISQKGLPSMFPNPASIWWGIFAGVVCAIGLKSAATAFADPKALVSVIAIIIAAYPIFTVAISLTVLNEARQVITWKLLIGTIMVLFGGYLATASIK